MFSQNSITTKQKAFVESLSWETFYLEEWFQPWLSKSDAEGLLATRANSASYPYTFVVRLGSKDESLNITYKTSKYAHSVDFEANSELRLGGSRKVEHESLKRTSPVLGDVFWKLDSSSSAPPKRLEEQIEVVAKCKLEPLKPGSARGQHRLVDQAGFPYYFSLNWLWPELDEEVAKSKLTEPLSCIAFWTPTPSGVAHQSHGIRICYTTNAVPLHPQVVTIEPSLTRSSSESAIHGWSQSPFAMFPDVVKHLGFRSFIPFNGDQKDRDLSKLMWAALYHRLDLIQLFARTFGMEWIRTAKTVVHKLTPLSLCFKEPRFSPMLVEYPVSQTPDLVPFDPRVVDLLEKKVGIDWDDNTTLIALDCWTETATDELLTRLDWFTVANHLVGRFRTNTAKRILAAVTSATSGPAKSSAATTSITHEIGSKLLFTLFDKAPPRDGSFVLDRYNPISSEEKNKLVADMIKTIDYDVYYLALGSANATVSSTTLVYKATNLNDSLLTKFFTKQAIDWDKPIKANKSLAAHLADEIQSKTPDQVLAKMLEGFIGRDRWTAELTRAKAAAQSSPPLGIPKTASLPKLSVVIQDSVNPPDSPSLGSPRHRSNSFARSGSSSSSSGSPARPHRQSLSANSEVRASQSTGSMETASPDSPKQRYHRSGSISKSSKEKIEKDKTDSPNRRKQSPMKTRDHSPLQSREKSPSKTRERLPSSSSTASTSSDAIATPTGEIRSTSDPSLLIAASKDASGSPRRKFSSRLETFVNANKDSFEAIIAALQKSNDKFLIQEVSDFIATIEVTKR